MNRPMHQGTPPLRHRGWLAALGCSASVLIAACDNGASLMLPPDPPAGAPEAPASPDAVSPPAEHVDDTDVGGNDGRGAAPPFDSDGPSAMPPQETAPDDPTVPQDGPEARPSPVPGEPSAPDDPAAGASPSEPGAAPHPADDGADDPDDPPHEDPAPGDPAPGDPGPDDPGDPDDPDPIPSDPSEPEPVGDEPAPPPADPGASLPGSEGPPSSDGPAIGNPSGNNPPSNNPAEDDPSAVDPPRTDSPGSDDVVGPRSPEIPGGLPSFHISLIGSSTASGFGASTGAAAWASLLEASLQERATTPVTVSNLAVGGYTAHDLAPGSGMAGSIDVAIAEKPDLILIALAGSNDLDGTLTTDVFISELVSLRDTARAAGVPSFFMGTLPKNFTDDNRRLLVDFDRAMASEFGACWIPGASKPYAPCFVHVFESLADASLGLAPEFDSGDGQHPNDAGHALLFQAAAAIVEPYMCSKTSCR